MCFIIEFKKGSETTVKNRSNGPVRKLEKTRIRREQERIRGKAGAGRCAALSDGHKKSRTPPRANSTVQRAGNQIKNTPERDVRVQKEPPGGAREPAG